MSTDLVVPGRVVLNGWRLMMKELPPMTQYDVHSIAYQVTQNSLSLSLSLCVCVCVCVCVCWSFSLSLSPHLPVLLSLDAIELRYVYR